MHSIRVYFSVEKNKLILSKSSVAGTEDVHKLNWPFYEPVVFLNNNLVSRSTKSNVTLNDLTFKNDNQKLLYDTEDIAPSKTASKKFNTFKNTQTNESNREAANTLKNPNELKIQHSSSKTIDDILSKWLLYIKNSNDGAAKELLKLDIHRVAIISIHHNGGPHNATIAVPQFGKLPSFVRVNFIKL